MSELILPVKQGEELNIGFTINQDGQPMDLTEYMVRVQVKRTPLVNASALINKEITVDSDLNTVGQINLPQQGQFILHLGLEDTSYPTGEYSLIISIEQPGFVDIISSKCCNKAIYKICQQ